MKNKKLKGYSHIIDDGDCDGHGYIIPKPKSKFTPIPDGGCKVANVPKKKLLAVLDTLSKNQTKRIKDAVKKETLILN